jgi:hypothetical protein
VTRATTGITAEVGRTDIGTETTTGIIDEAGVMRRMVEVEVDTEGRDMTTDVVGATTTGQGGEGGMTGIWP